MDKNIVKGVIRENKELFDLFAGLYTLLGSVKAARNVGISESLLVKPEEDIKNDLEKIKKVLNISSLEEDEAIKSFALEWGECQFNWLLKET